ncbi:hypothetical protein D3C87_1279950 [compost metagenome]
MKKIDLDNFSNHAFMLTRPDVNPHSHYPIYAENEKLNTKISGDAREFVKVAKGFKEQLLKAKPGIITEELLNANELVILHTTLFDGRPFGMRYNSGLLSGNYFLYCLDKKGVLKTIDFVVN